MILWNRINSRGRRSGSKELRPYEKGGETDLKIKNSDHTQKYPSALAILGAVLLLHLRLSSGLIVCLC